MDHCPEQQIILQCKSEVLESDHQLCLIPLHYNLILTSGWSPPTASFDPSVRLPCSRKIKEMNFKENQDSSANIFTETCVHHNILAQAASPDRRSKDLSQQSAGPQKGEERWTLCSRHRCLVLRCSQSGWTPASDLICSADVKLLTLKWMLFSHQWVCLQVFGSTTAYEKNRIKPFVTPEAALRSLQWY